VQHFATREQARIALAAWIEDYNTRRRHSSCQKMPQTAYEQLLAAREEAA
jgi:transposase InsO family protein